MKKIILEIENAVKKLDKQDKALHLNLLEKIEDSTYVWRADYTIAVAKDNSKTKVANIMVCSELNETEQTFQVKREHDFWKKLDAREEYKAVVECAVFDTSSDICAIEKVARDVMRSRKEVHNVAALGFVWLVRVEAQQNLDEVFKLYFKEDYKCVEQDAVKYYIGWTEKLKELDMRHFVCPPIMKRGK